MGKFKQISITINEFIKYVLVIISFVSTLGLFMTSVENTKLKERIVLIEEDRGQMMREIKELQK